ncbi:hypothetical protein [Bordetella sp. FB-8]|uniref:glycoside hydrolase family 113 n=1 Tax=Bordetella sp. FB-8 TaxID=1159870 RepID=UPI0012DC26AB|nr:hypothetical protein [Bordetella sp. FB-8]
MLFPSHALAPAARGTLSIARYGIGAALTAAGLLAASASLAATGMAARAGNPASNLCSPAHRGFDLVQDKHVALGSLQAHASLQALRDTGANTVAIVPLLRQSRPDTPDVDRSLDMSDGELAHFIRQAHKLGLQAVVDPRIQVSDGRPDDVRMGSDRDWAAWFHHYEQALVGLAAVAADEHAQALVIGTDLDQTLSRPEWTALIARLRRVYPGRLIYAAQGAAGAQRVPFWNKLDAVGVTLQPVLDAAGGPASWRAALAGERKHLLALARQTGRPIFVAELGFSAGPNPAAQADSHAMPPPSIDATVQSRALSTWLAELSNPAIRTVLVWRWNQAEQNGGFIAQDKKIAQAMTRRWRSCSRAPAVW